MDKNYSWVLIVGVIVVLIFSMSFISNYFNPSNTLNTLIVDSSNPAEISGFDNEINNDALGKINSIEESDSINPYADLITIDLADDDPRKGNEGAPIIMVEFSDFQCPFCGSFYKYSLPLIEENYISTGKVQFVYRDYPLKNHTYSKSAAVAAECTNEQGKFWEFHDKIFDNQSSLNNESLQLWAEEIGLNMTEFNECIILEEINAEVDKDFEDAESLGVGGTPNFFIGKRNGPPQRIRGNQPFSVFKEVIDSLLE